MRNFYFPYIEWEILRKPVTITQIDQNQGLPDGKKKIRINRDEDYNLKGLLEFEDPSPKGVYFKPHTNVAGTIAKIFDIHGSSHDISYIIESVVIGDVNITRISEGEEQNTGTAKLHFKALKIKYNNKNEGTHLVEWFLNGPTDHIFWERTERKEKINYIRNRYDSEDKKIDSIDISAKSEASGGDYLWMDLSDFQFLIGKVPNEFGPEWSSNIGIEYKKEWGGIPNIRQREEIEELCSFIFGRQLLSIGYSLLDQKDKLVEAYCHDPWGKNAKSFCSNVAYPPIRIDFPFSRSPKELISQLMPKYFESSDLLRLTEAVWYIWVSREMPIGTNLPILAAALESIINGWFKSKSESHGVYLKKEIFESSIEKEIDKIRKKLDAIFETEKERSNVQKIVNKILRANEFGVMERYRIFFEEIDLKAEPHEWKAINERHKFVHGHARFKEADWSKVLSYVNTYETLLNKVILKLLGYSGKYIDRSTAGWTDKKLA